MQLMPLGDQAILAYLDDEGTAVHFSRAVQAANPPWLFDVVPAYATVGVFFDLTLINLQEVQHWLEALPVANNSIARTVVEHTIPVCYERQLDLSRVCEATGLTFENVIHLHHSTQYQVFAIGFVPGFPYLGYLPELLRGVSRLPSPRMRVEAGSVGLTGRQTGLYPLTRPGGWNIIGQTPLTVVDVEDEFFPIQVGDIVRFQRIDEAEFTQLEGERLPVAVARFD